LEKDGKALQKKLTSTESALDAIEEKLIEKKAELSRLTAVVKARTKVNEIAIQEEEVAIMIVLAE
jgi:hypothetical protein